MTVKRVTTVLLIVILAGVAVLSVFGVSFWLRTDRYEDEMRALFDLQKQVDTFSVASDALLLPPREPGALTDYRRDATDLQTRLEAWRDTVPAVGRAIDTIDEMVGVAESSVARATDDIDPGVLRRMAAHGVVLDTVMADVVRARHMSGSGGARAAATLFAVAASIFAALAVLAAWQLRHQVGRPVARLVRVARRVADGDREVRAGVEGTDEIARLAATFNAMLDRIQETEAQLLARQAELTATAEFLATSQRIAQVGSWSWSTERNPMRWSTETFRILGADPTTVQPSVEAFLGVVHPEDADAVETDLAALIRGEGPDRADIRIVRPDGAVRHVRILVEPADDDALGRVYVGTIQDLTDIHAIEAELAEQRWLAEMAGEVGRFGGWWADLDADRIVWSDVVCDVHEVPRGTRPTLDEALEHYVPEHRETIARAFRRCLESGVPYDTELQIVTSSGRRVWVRTTGVAARDGAGRIVRVQGAFQDVDERKRAELHALALDRRLRDTLESLTHAFLTVDAAWRCTFVNGAAEALLGVPRTELLGQDIWSVLPAMLGEDAASQARRSARDHTVTTLQTRIGPDRRWFDVRFEPIDDGLAMILRDVDEMHAMVESLQAHQRDLSAATTRLQNALELQEALISSLPAHIAVIDHDGTIIEVNEQWRRYGRKNDSRDGSYGVGRNYLAVARSAAGPNAEGADAAASGLEDVLAGARSEFSIDYPCHAPDRERWFRMEVRPLPAPVGPESRRAVVMHVDVTDAKLTARRLEALAFEDALTGLPTRVGFTRELERRVADHGWPVDGVVVTLDVAEMANVNDAHGYEAGDRLLRSTAERLRAWVGPTGLAARVSGDEFAAFVVHAGVDAETVVHELISNVFGPRFEVVAGIEVDVDAHVGFTRLDTTPRQVESLLRQAELALSHERRTSGVGWGEYSDELDRTVHERARLARQLRDGLARDELRLHFQPKVDLATGELFAAEALVRWDHPERGLLAPGAFIAVAEEAGLIGRLGSWVLDAACRSLALWRADGLTVVRISVNVSVDQFKDEGFVDEVRGTLERHDVAPDDLTLEITENVFASDSDALRRQLAELHDLGVHLALDDFGTGFSSLMYLKRYPFDEIKIDRAFVSDMLHDAYSRDVVATVLGIASTLGAAATAEGVESSDVCDALLGMGCTAAQGFYFSVPLDEEDFRWLLEKRSPLPLGRSR